MVADIGADLAMIEIQHRATRSGLLREVQGQVKSQPRPHGDRNARWMVGQLMTRRLGQDLQEYPIVEILEENLQNLGLVQAAQGRGDKPKGASNDLTVIGWVGEAIEKRTEKLRNVVSEGGDRIIRPPQVGFLKEDLQIQRKTARFGC